MHKKVPQNRIKDSLRRIDNYRFVLEYVRQVQRTRWFDSKRAERMPELRKLSRDVLWKVHEDGHYIGNTRSRPFGWNLVQPINLKEEKRSPMIWDLERSAEEFPVLREIVEDYYIFGKGTEQIRDELMRRGVRMEGYKIRDILFSSIRIHVGYVRYEDDWAEGTHKKQAVVSDEVWRTIIEPRLKASKPQYLIGRRVITGFIRNFDEWVHDTTEIEVAVAKSRAAVSVRKSTVEAEVERAWKLRREGASVGMIASETGFSKGTLINMFRDSTYANKIRVADKAPDEWPDAGVKPYVIFQDWLEIQKIRDSRPFWLIGKEFGEKRRDAGVLKIETFLRTHGPALTGEIVNGIGLSDASVRAYLRGPLKKKVGREPKWFGRWYLLETTNDLEIDQTEPTKDTILGVLEEPLALGEIPKKARISRDRAKYWLPKLIAQGLVEKRRTRGKRYPVYVSIASKRKQPTSTAQT
jgi:hypothetical protein